MILSVIPSPGQSDPLISSSRPTGSNVPCKEIRKRIRRKRIKTALCSEDRPPFRQRAGIEPAAPARTAAINSTISPVPILCSLHRSHAPLRASSGPWSDCRWVRAQPSGIAFPAAYLDFAFGNHTGGLIDDQFGPVPPAPKGKGIGPDHRLVSPTGMIEAGIGESDSDQT